MGSPHRAARPPPCAACPRLLHVACLAYQVATRRAGVVAHKPRTPADRRRARAGRACCTTTNRKASTDERKPLAVRVAATGDLHCCAGREDEVRAVLTDASADAEMLLLAGDLTSLGKPEEAALLARVCQALDVPTFAVLGNHDWHCARHDQVVA